MPIPTDTFWNIRRLNKIFAFSALVMLLTFAWAVFQDYAKSWRDIQREGRHWQAALTEARIERMHARLSAADQARLAQISAEMSAKDQEINQKDPEVQKLKDRVKGFESRIAYISVDYNNIKAIVGVFDGQIQDARTAGDTALVAKLIEGRKEPAAKTAQGAEALAAAQTDLAQVKKELDDREAVIDDLKKQKALLQGDVDALWKRVDSLEPKSMLSRMGTRMREAPLLQFMNPAEKPRQHVLNDVLMDVSFGLKIATIDRCDTCHVNIDNKDFAKPKVIAYLETQTAALPDRQFVYPVPDAVKPNPLMPTPAKPGASALPEFWYSWGRILLPPAAQSKAITPNQIKAIAATVGTKIEVKYEGKPVEAPFVYDEHATDEQARKRQDAIFAEAIKALYRIATPEKTVAGARNSALMIPEKLRAALESELPAEQYKQLVERYRFAMVELVNRQRSRTGEAALDPSPVQLAHPRLDLYVQTDSPHPMEAVGCTSCHDGSGDETDFILAAHTARRIWVDRKSGEPVLASQLVNPPVEHHAPSLNNVLEAVYPHGSVVPEKVALLGIDLASPEGAGHEEAEVPEDAEPTAYMDPVSGRGGTAVPQLTYWKEKYGPESPSNFRSVEELWDFPMRPPQYLEANCARCHNNFHDIKETAPVLYEGRSLFAKLGCVDCHAMSSVADDDKRKIGTDLRHVTSKLSPAFINTWIWAPKAFRPSTLMPHFFMLENSSSPEELRRTRQEARAITEYLVQTSTAWKPEHKAPAAVSGDADRGRQIFQSIGCQGCHSNLNETGQEWITTDLQKRYGLSSADAQGKFDAMGYNQRHMYALENFGQIISSGPQNKYADGKPMPVFMHHGPELSGIGDKLTVGRSVEEARAWLFDWLKEPRHYSDYTVMPQLRLDDQQAMDVAEYLLGQHRKNKNPDDTWSATLFAVDEPKLAEMAAFFLRSQFSDLTADKKAVDPDEMATRAADAMTTPAAALADASTVVVSAEEATARAKALTLEQRQMVFLGSKLIATYGCMNCHKINNTEGIASPCADLSDWGQKSVDKLDFGYLDPHKVESLPPISRIPIVNGLSPEVDTTVTKAYDDKQWDQHLGSVVEAAWPRVEHSRTSWITQKLMNPRVWDRGKNLLDPVRETAEGRAVLKDGYPQLAARGKPYDKLKMPAFYLGRHDIDALVTFVISNRNRLISNKMLDEVNNEEAARIAHGRQITERLNCVSCHPIEGNFPSVRQYYEREDWTTKAPPSLRGEGNKIQFAWLYYFLHNVEPLRPLPVIRMPTFPLTDEETKAVMAYFNAASVHESKQLKKLLDPVDKYVEAARGPATQPALAPDEPWPGDDWYRQDALADSAGKLRDWALDNQDMREAQFSTASSTLANVGINFRQVLFRAHFIQELYDAPYPFVDLPHPTTDEKRFKNGEAFFDDMQCLKCHVMGDASAPGANKAPTAPNLGLAYKRLQSRWITHWVQEPPFIQTNTLMPAFFTGLPVFNPHGQVWPLAQGMSPEVTKQEMEKYGTATTEEQRQLLIDFLYSAGMRNYTAVLPADLAPPGTAAPATQPAAGIAP